MNHLDYWSKISNPATGGKFEHWHASLHVAHNGEMDIDSLIAGEYGRKMTELADIRFRFEEDPMGEQCLSFYKSLNIKKEMFEYENFYTRWTLFTPMDISDFSKQGKKLPFIFWNHGGANAIEVDEFSTKLVRMVNSEKFIVVMLQDTNWENVKRILSIVERKYPVDTERVYIMGFSQGGQTASSAMMRMSEVFAAAAPCGNEIFSSVDNKNIDYTLDEVAKLTYTFVPMLQMVGQCDMGNYAPLNLWRERKDWGSNLPRVSLYRNPQGDYKDDPTNRSDERKARKAEPWPGADPDRWKVNRLNLRLATLSCVPRNIEKCMSYQNSPEDELHHITGFYGDREQIKIYDGLKHYIVDIDNREGVNAFRYIVLEKSPHWPMNMMGELAWDFFKKFRRDAVSGKIIVDDYKL
jgi:hypothetical protein